MEILWLLTILFLSILGIWILCTIKDMTYFSGRGIPYLGNMNYPMVFFNQNIAENSLYWYKKAQNQNLKIAGITALFVPTIIVRDPDLIKKIMVKDFDHFVDHRIFKSSTQDWVLKKFLGMSSGEEWKFKRNKVTPAFSSGKIRRMFQLFNHSCIKLVHYLEQEIITCTQIDLAECFLKFTTDVVASVAFGLDIKAFDEKKFSEFQKMGEKLKPKSKGLEILKSLFMECFPKKVSDFLGLSVLPLDAQNYFAKIIRSEIKRRSESGEKREDFIQLMMEAKKIEFETEDSNLNKFTFDDDDITAQSVGFILAGLDATNASMVFLPYVLALNPDVQNRLYQEISNSLKETSGKFTYESINKMEYLDMVMNETLRLYSPGLFTDRACTKDYKIPDSNITIKKSEIVFIPLLGLQRDPSIYDEPERFEPERWTAENRSKIHPYSFLPFGHGPRNCPAMRFGLSQIKLAIAYLVNNFNFEPCEKTLIPMKFGSGLTLKPRDGMWLTTIKRK